MLSPIRLVSKAAEFAARRHNGKARKARPDEPYINHLAEVANILAEVTDGADAELVAAGEIIAIGIIFVAIGAAEVEVVRDGDAVLLPEGYHPNVAIPGSTLNFVWIMAAHREVLDRRWGVVQVDSRYA